MYIKTTFRPKMRQRIIRHGELFLQPHHQIRTVAEETGFCKSTVHIDLYRLEHVDKKLFMKVLEKIKRQLDTRHLKAGEVIKKRFEELQKA